MRITAILRQAARPSIVCLDLDHTLWPWAVDKFEVFKPPYRLRDDKNVYDSDKKLMTPFPEVTKCLQYLKDDGFEVAAIGRCYYHPGPFALFKYYDWAKYFDYAHIMPFRKFEHFLAIQEMSQGVPYNQMMLFDDRQDDIDHVAPLGVHCVKVDPNKGLTLSLVEQGLREFAKKAGSQEKVKASASNK